VNQLSADYVFITGDLIDGRNISEQELSVLANLKAPTYFIIGNHERYVDLEAICTRLGNLGVLVLRNESHTLGDIQLVGIDDAEARTQVSAVLTTIEPLPDKFRILLYHRPDGVRDAAAWGAHLMLCGHTHSGQIFPVNYLVKRFFPQFRGTYQEKDLLLYISPGTGTWGPVLRLGSRSEISMIRLL
ncbi:MAG: metallophosphoesterase, partial [Pseudomonadales bacterium]